MLWKTPGVYAPTYTSKGSQDSTSPPGDWLFWFNTPVLLEQAELMVEAEVPDHLVQKHRMRFYEEAHTVGDWVENREYHIPEYITPPIPSECIISIKRCKELAYFLAERHDCERVLAPEYQEFGEEGLFGRIIPWLLRLPLEIEARPITEVAKLVSATEYNPNTGIGRKIF